MTDQHSEQKEPSNGTSWPDENQSKPHSNSEQLKERHDIKNTPYIIWGNKDHGYYISFGRYQICPTLQSVQECEEWFHNYEYDALINTMMALIHADKEVEKDLQANRLRQIMNESDHNLLGENT